MKIRTALLIAVFSIALAAAQTPDQQPPGDTPQGGDFSSNPDARKVPWGVILLKGAVPSASHLLRALPGGGTIAQQYHTHPHSRQASPPSPSWRTKYQVLLPSPSLT